MGYLCKKITKEKNGDKDNILQSAAGGLNNAY